MRCEHEILDRLRIDAPKPLGVGRRIGVRRFLGDGYVREVAGPSLSERLSRPFVEGELAQMDNGPGRGPVALVGDRAVVRRGVI